MNKKFKKMLEPNVRLYFVLLIVFAVITFFYSQQNRLLAVIEAAVIIVLFIYSRLSGRRRKKEMMDYIESISETLNAASSGSMHNFPLPMAVCGIDDGRILSANDKFMKMTGERDHFFEIKISDVIPDFTMKWLMEGKTESSDLVQIGDRKYRVYGNLVRGEKEPGVRGFFASLYWMDITHFARVSEEFEMSRPVFSIIMIDNYDELIQGMSDKDKSAILSEIDEKIGSWAGGCGGYLSKFDRDRYIFVFEERHLQGFINGKFALLDSVRQILGNKGIAATISIGIGKDGKTMAENYQFASLGIEMALSRGGDQAVIKNRFNFEFYGGRSSEMEKRTKVKSRVMANSLSELIRAASKVYVMGHKYADIDSIGSAVGICCAARKLQKTAKIVVDEDNNVSKQLISRMLSLPEYQDVFISPQDAIVEADASTLLIVVDTNRPEQTESEALLMSCNRVAIIDHHRRAATYIQNAVLSFHEPYASSASELVTELLQYIVEQSDILRYEAEAILCGIMLDTKNFTLRTGSRTFDAAAFLRRAGADTSEVKKLLQSDMPTTVARYAIIQKAKVYKRGIAIAAPETQQDRIIAAQAADELLNIQGIQASFVVYPDNDYISVSARSIGDINVQLIVEKLGGGGNKSTAGAQIRDCTLKESVAKLLTAIDQYLQYGEE